MSLAIDDDVLPEWTTDVKDQEQTKHDEPNSENTAIIDSRVGCESNNTQTQTTTIHERRWNWWEMIKRDGSLLLITIAIIVLMNIPIVKHLLYPLDLFSTWVHELCHGFAGIMVGGKIEKILIFPDTSGLAYTLLPADDGKQAFVASAGYQGTAVVGCLLLIFRRTKRGPRTGTMTLAVTMLLSTVIWIRNAFGFIMIALLSAIFCGCGWQLPSARIRDFYTCVAVTTALNAITSVKDLFGSNQYVNGEPSNTDAHTMSEVAGGPYWFWALLWLFLAVLMTVVGLIFAIPGPDECADFKCCGVCVDLGIFNVCNKSRSRTVSEN